MNFQETIGEIRLEDVVEMTEEFFGPRPTVEEEFDPENPNYRHLVVSVAWDSAPKEVVQKQLEWHE